MQNTSWDVTCWTDQMKIQWQKEVFQQDYRWPLHGTEVVHLDANSYYLHADGQIAFSEESVPANTGFYIAKTWEDMKWQLTTGKL